MTDRPLTDRPPTDPAPPASGPAVPPEDTQAGILANSAVMAAGTVVSRLSGFVRSALLAAALGLSLHADIFNIGNTVPNMLYILLAGGVLNAVLVPQLVRAQKNDPDGGEAYTQRVVTVAGLFLLVVTVLLVAAAPLVMAVYLDGSWNDPALAEQRQSVIDFARFCLPQVFFYGMFVLVGQILNARGRFGPMMWAPIANNVISVVVLVVYLVVFGPARGADAEGAFTSGQEALLGLGATVGIAAQLLILLPYLRSAGFRFRPRLDLRGAGLGHTARLGVWSLLFVVVNQVAYTVVVRLASSGTTGGGTEGTGYAVYAAAFLIVMVPHSIITVSLTTAVLPQLSRRAAADELPALARDLAGTLRTALVVVVPFAALLPALAPDIANVVWGHGAAAQTYRNAVPTLTLFGAGLVFFTVHYLMLRGFYALEQTRTVFLIQCAVSTTNVVAALVLVAMADAADTAPALVLAYTTSYVVGSAISYQVLRHRLGGLETPALVGFGVVLLLCTAAAAAVVLPLGWLLGTWLPDPHWSVAAVRGAGLALVGVVVFVLVARWLRLREVTSVLALVARRVPVLRGR
ncbi:murein biosynthesis integral membrane protein MurJ [Nocardioides nanhaiensis]|uniref:Murein biosynthesis integral membrane protein MurJ n=1 Tax=Nocardioides nanhaiensis TaxID=1476871 RepID=A0ABP8VQL6_9ACTN